MSAAKHTPGPWHAEGNHIVSGSVRVAVVDTPRIHAGVDESEADANARLVASAPALLDALRVFVSEYVALVKSGDAGFWDAENEQKVIAARAAIAAATGGIQ